MNSEQRNNYNNMSEYLYGAAVQGIQDFIFQTNKLREIVGASELVESICTDLFAAVLYACSDEEKEKDPKKRREKLISRLYGENENNNAKGYPVVNAAGNIKYVFKDKDECERVAKIFPMTVMQFAPGITISQSVVELEKGGFAKAVQELEKNLRTQRNRPVRDMNLGLMGILRSRATGLPVTHKRGKEYMDSATFHKLYDTKGTDRYFDDKGKRKTSYEPLCEKSFGEKVPVEKLPLDIKNMTGDNDWIAIIHADGNGLGQIVQKIGSEIATFRKFSRKLDEATEKAAQRAYDKIIKDLIKNEGWTDNDYIPMRPIVLSGDDHTMICRADLAIPYTEAFLDYFEDETKTKLGDILKKKEVFGKNTDKLTACAGIAFIKSSFPFHFGYNLAESLCSRAKKDTKRIFKADDGNLPAGCLMFHKVQDSFVTDFNDIARRELTPQKDISFEYGPYYLYTDDEKLKDRWSISGLTNKAKELEGEEGNKVRSGLRNWLTLLHENPDKATQRLNRLIEITPNEKMENLIHSIAGENGSAVRKVKKDGESYDIRIYPVYDMLTVCTINNQVTR